MHSDERQETIHQRHDTSYRFQLSSKKLFVELLRSFVNKGWVQSIDETNVQEIPHSLFSKILNARKRIWFSEYS